MFFCKFFYLIIIESAGIAADGVLHGFIEFARNADFPAVGQDGRRKAAKDP